MSYTREREEFFARMAREGWREDLTRAVLRAAATLQRLAVAQCNGDFPADHGDAWPVKACDECGSGWHPSALKRRAYLTEGNGGRTYYHLHSCPDCRTSARLRARLQAEAPGWAAMINGDPRGYVVKIHAATETREDLQSGRARTVGVPARG